MLWALLILGTVLAVEGFFRLPLGAEVKRLQRLLQKISHTISTPTISDHWKEKVLPNYAGQLFVLSIKLFVIVCLAISPFFLIGLLAGIVGIPFMAFLATPIAIGASTALATLYAVVRIRIGKRGTAEH